MNLPSYNGGHSRKKAFRMNDVMPANAAFAPIRSSWIFAALIAGLAIGLLLASQSPVQAEAVAAAIEPLGQMWLKALQMTILPLIIALMFTGIASTVEAARGGAMARRSLLHFGLILASGAIMAALLTPALLAAFPAPDGARQALLALLAEPREKIGDVPGFAAFLTGLVPANIFTAAHENAILPIILFTSLFACAAMQLGPDRRAPLTAFFESVGDAMLIVIGWVLALAPIGVFALALVVAARSGSAALGALAHYVAIVTAIGTVVLIAAYAIAITRGRQKLLPFARAMIPAQSLAISTQSSLASLPAMIASARQLGLRESSIDFVLPLAVALFRATGPAMNLAVAIYVAHLMGMVITPQMLIIGIAVATLTTLGAVSMPGAISFVTSIGPIALAMGVPVEPLALLVAVEMIPDLMRTIANVTMDVAVTAAIDEAAGVGDEGKTT